VVLVQLTPLTPVIDHKPVPVGDAPPFAPATVAVKVKIDPSEVVGVLVVTVTVGVTLVIGKLKVVEGPALL
jgi:hypothetical protein